MFKNPSPRVACHVARTSGIAALLILFCVSLVPAAAAQTGVLFVENDRVGVGTDTPEFDFEVEGEDSRVLVDTTSGAASNRTLLELRNSGAVQIFLKNVSDNIIWQMSAFKSSLQLSRAGASAGVFRVLNSGGVQALNGASVLMWLKKHGDLEIAGYLSQGSSREIKTAINPVDGARILDQVVSLPIATWAYDGRPEEALHIGPMAEDFYASFGFGSDDRHLAPGDLAGVALASVQQLHAELQSETAKRHELEEQNRQLEDRLAALEALVARLAPGEAGTASQ